MGYSTYGRRSCDMLMSMPLNYRPYRPSSRFTHTARTVLLCRQYGQSSTGPCIDCGVMRRAVPVVLCWPGRRQRRTASHATAHCSGSNHLRSRDQHTAAQHGTHVNPLCTHLYTATHSARCSCNALYGLAAVHPAVYTAQSSTQQRAGTHV
jgi:hypothetical protein